MEADEASREEYQHEKLKLMLIIIGWSMSQYADPADIYERKQAGMDEGESDDS
jgi:hypothetical protein